MKKIVILSFCVTFSTFAQNSVQERLGVLDFLNKSTIPPKTEKSPAWASFFYTNPDSLDLKKVEYELNLWVEENQNLPKDSTEKKENDLKENPFLRFFLQWRRTIPSNWLKENNIVKAPTQTSFIQSKALQESTQKRFRVNDLKNQKKRTGAASSAWSLLGPMEIYSSHITGLGQPVPWNTNLYYLGIAPSNNNILMTCSETDAIFKSVDKGLNWTYVRDGRGPIAFHPTDPNQIFIASTPFTRTTNGGTSWTSLNIGSESNTTVWSPNGTTIMVAGAALWVSSDGGINFQQKLTGNFYDVVFRPNSSTQAYAIRQDGQLFSTNDAGLNWSPIAVTYTAASQDGYLLSVSPANVNLICIAQLRGETIEIYTSTNSGTSFVSVGRVPDHFSQGFYDFVFKVSPTNTSILLAGTTSLYKSNSHWQVRHSTNTHLAKPLCKLPQ